MKSIVWLASYPKSGNTWLRVFLANYIAGEGSVVNPNEIERYSKLFDSGDFEEFTGLIPCELTPDEIDIYRPDLYRHYSSQNRESDSPLILKIHDAYTFNNNNQPIFPQDVSRVAIYAVRNPLDVCVSYSSHLNQPTDKIIRMMCNEDCIISSDVKQNSIRQIINSWSSHARSWIENSSIPVHLVRYEDMLANPLESFGSIVKASGLEFSLNRVKWAVENSSFQKLQDSERESSFIIKTLSGNHFFRKGRSGDYSNHLSDSQIQKLVEYNYQMMRVFNYIDSSGNLTV